MVAISETLAAVLFFGSIAGILTFFLGLPSAIIGIRIFFKKKNLKLAEQAAAALETKINELLSQKAEFLNQAEATQDITAKINFSAQALKIDDKIESLKAEKK